MACGTGWLRVGLMLGGLWIGGGILGCGDEAESGGGDSAEVLAPQEDGADDDSADSETAKLEPLAMSLEAIGQRLNPHSEVAIATVGDLKVADTVRVFGYLAQLTGDLSRQEGEHLMLEKVGYDYYENIQEWSASLPPFSRQLWSSEWQQPLPEEPGYVVRFQIRQEFDLTKRQKPGIPVMSELIEKLLAKFRANCFDEAPDPREHEAWISYVTISGRAFEEYGDDEYYLFEARWHLPSE